MQTNLKVIGWIGALSLLAASCKTQPAPQRSASLPGRAQKERISAPEGELIRAVMKGEDGRILQLLNSGADINETLGSGPDLVTPLFAAIISRNKSAASILIRNGAALDPTYKGYSAEDLALYFDDHETARLIQQYKKLQNRGRQS